MAKRIFLSLLVFWAVFLVCAIGGNAAGYRHMGAAAGIILCVAAIRPVSLMFVKDGFDPVSRGQSVPLFLYLVSCAIWLNCVIDAL